MCGRWQFRRLTNKFDMEHTWVKDLLNETYPIILKGKSLELEGWKKGLVDRIISVWTWLVKHKTIHLFIVCYPRVRLSDPSSNLSPKVTWLLHFSMKCINKCGHILTRSFALARPSYNTILVWQRSVSCVQWLDMSGACSVERRVTFLHIEGQA